jgi:hypothetical protein
MSCLGGFAAAELVFASPTAAKICDGLVGPSAQDTEPP